MILNRTGPTPFYQFSALIRFKHLFHGIFSRHAGCSRAPYDSLNVGFSVGDEVARVRRNRQRVRVAAGVDRLVFLQQGHGNEVVVLRTDRPAEVDQALAKPPPADAVVTDIRRLGLVVQLADCQPVLLYAADRQVTAGVHSGWRGSLQNVIGRTVDRMRQEFGCDPTRLYAGVGPSLGPCCGEFVNYRTEIPTDWWSYKRGENHFDFWAVSRDQLLQAGLPPGNISIGGICTRCRTDEFFSYRGEGVTGRFAAVTALL